MTTIPTPRIVSAIAVLLLGAASFLRAGSKENQAMLVDTDWLEDHLNEPSLVVLHIAFAKSEYVAGHIPGARLVPWQSIVTPPPQPPGSGLTSELPPTAQLARLLGYGARIYDGSFQDWAKRSELQIEATIPPPTK